MSKEEICKICGVTTKQIKSHLKDWHGYVYTKDSPAYPVEPPASKEEPEVSESERKL